MPRLQRHTVIASIGFDARTLIAGDTLTLGGTAGIPGFVYRPVGPITIDRYDYLSNDCFALYYNGELMDTIRGVSNTQFQAIPPNLGATVLVTAARANTSRSVFYGMPHGVIVSNRTPPACAVCKREAGHSEECTIWDEH